jgi:hypothetical protein
LRIITFLNRKPILFSEQKVSFAGYKMALWRHRRAAGDPINFSKNPFALSLNAILDRAEVLAGRREHEDGARRTNLDAQHAPVRSL